MSPKRDQERKRASKARAQQNRLENRKRTRSLPPAPMPANNAIKHGRKIGNVAVVAITLIGLASSVSGLLGAPLWPTKLRVEPYAPDDPVSESGVLFRVLNKSLLFDAHVTQKICSLNASIDAPGIRNFSILGGKMVNDLNMTIPAQSDSSHLSCGAQMPNDSLKKGRVLIEILYYNRFLLWRWSDSVSLGTSWNGRRWIDDNP